jgi:hypothetical protein
MHDIWLAVDPRPPQARILATAGPDETLLKARLDPRPKHPRALATLLDALALWQGTLVRAALAVGEEEPWCDMGQYGVGFPDGGQSPLWSLDCIPRARRRRRRNELVGLGDYRDLRQLLLFEVSR